jgi:hypothetical protein
MSPRRLRDPIRVVSQNRERSSAESAKSVQSLQVSAKSTAIQKQALTPPERAVNDGMWG